MSDLQIFNSEQFGKIRAVEVDGQPWFCLADVCRPLGLRVADCKKRMKPEGVDTINTPTNSGIQGMIYVNEGNLYRAIFQSKKPEAEAFTDWVTEEVLPALRRTGAYVAPSAHPVSPSPRAYPSTDLQSSYPSPAASCWMRAAPRWKCAAWFVRRSGPLGFRFRLRSPNSSPAK